MNTAIRRGYNPVRQKRRSQCGEVVAITATAGQEYLRTLDILVKLEFEIREVSQQFFWGQLSIRAQLFQREGNHGRATEKNYAEKEKKESEPCQSEHLSFSHRQVGCDTEGGDGKMQGLVQNGNFLSLFSARLVTLVHGDLRHQGCADGAFCKDSGAHCVRCQRECRSIH
jgi:hypothetical protein